MHHVEIGDYLSNDGLHALFKVISWVLGPSEQKYKLGNYSGVILKHFVHLIFFKLQFGKKTSKKLLTYYKLMVSPFVVDCVWNFFCRKGVSHLNLNFLRNFLVWVWNFSKEGGGVKKFQTWWGTFILFVWTFSKTYWGGWLKSKHWKEL